MFEPLTSEFYSAKYFDRYPTIENAAKGIYFRYEKITERRKEFSQPINNLIAQEGRLTISTTYDLRVKVGGYVLTQEGRIYAISDFTTGQVQNEQRAFFFNAVEDLTVLSLVECENPLRLKV
jgi:hypothetical protein